MPACEIEYEASVHRCAWCWKATSASEGHTVASAVRSPALEMHFHNQCWIRYRATSEVEFTSQGVSRKWTPEKIEELRMHMGFNHHKFAKAIGVSTHRLLAILSGTEKSPTVGVLARIRKVAASARYEVRSDKMDWTQPDAVFCLRMHLRIGKAEFAEALGVNRNNVSMWQRKGCPLTSVRSHARLSRLATKSGFEGASIVKDRVWTAAFLREAIEKSGRSQSVWAAASGISVQAISGYLRGRPIHREACHRLSRAATELGASLPPEGEATNKGQSKQRRPATSVKLGDPSPNRRWTLGRIRHLGTAPDHVIASELGVSSEAVRLMRRALGIPLIQARTWNGIKRPRPFRDAELTKRFQAYCVRVRDAARKRRGRTSTAKASKKS